MAPTGGDKPYRVYRGGRIRGSVPTLPRPTPRPKQDGAGRVRYPGPGPAKKPKRRNWRRRIVIAAVALAVLLVAWLVAGYLSIRSGVQEANERLGRAPRAALTDQKGLLLSKPTNILLLGVDFAPVQSRAGSRRADSVMLVRTNPDTHRLTYLSIPRDLRVPIPGQGFDRVNAAFQIGGPALAIRTVRGFTGLPVHHVMIVNMWGFRDLVNALGGITVDVPAPILSNRFDCPRKTVAACETWPGWRFEKGRQRMGGRRALVYARIRQNRLNPAESDFTRGARQQQVLQAITDKLTSPTTFVRLPFVGSDVMKPLATDLEPNQLLQLAWLKFRAPAKRAVHCRLGGTPSNIGGASVILGTEENVNVINMVAGRSAPQPPLPGSGPFGPGCVVGKRSFR